MNLTDMLAENPHLRLEYEDCILPSHGYSGPTPPPVASDLVGRPLIYVAAFYTANPAFGMRAAIDAWAALLALGFTPLVPHTSFLLDVLYPHSPAFWYEYDLALLARCDAIYISDDALTDVSTGVADERTFALTHSIPVLRGLTEANAWMEAHR
jgi:nucleoside 2-deoxyribosyltransferase